MCDYASTLQMSMNVSTSVTRAMKRHSALTVMDISAVSAMQDTQEMATITVPVSCV